MKTNKDILDQPTTYSGTTSSRSIIKGEYKMATFKPEVDYAGFKRNNISCRVCNDQLNANNYGEMIDEFRGYAPANSFYLAKWGFFCNPCGVKVIKAEEEEYNKNTKTLTKKVG